MTTPAWYATHLRRLFFDMHLPDWTQKGQAGGDQHELRDIATRFDPEHLIREFVRARINVAVIFAKCQYGNFYYNTRIGHKHTGLGDLDFLGEMLTHAKRAGIRVIAYYSNMWDTQAAREHPDWMAEEADGSYSYNRWPTMSLLSPYRDLVHDHLREILTHYDVDGIWSDILSDLPSFDRYTRWQYESDCGEPMPRSTSDPGWLRFVRWQQDMMYEYIRSCRDLVKAIRPDAAYVVNFFGTPYALASQGLSFKNLALSDMGSTEGYTEWHGLLFPSYAARYIRAGVNNRPFEVLTGRFVHTWDFTLRSHAQMRYEAFSFHDSPLTDNMIRRPLPHYMAIWEVRLNHPDVRIAATRRDPLIETRGETYYHNNQPPPGEDTGQPVLVYREVGRGRVVYCAALPESNYARLGHEPYRSLIASMIHWAAGALPPVRAEGLLNTEIVLNILGPDMMLHLVTGIPQRAVRFGLNRTTDSIEEEARLGPVTLDIPAVTQAAFRLPQSERLEISRKDGRASITLPEAGDWETIRLVGKFDEGGVIA